MNEILSFEDEAQAYAEIEAMGYHAMAFDFPLEENDLHWHDFDSVLYVTAGELTVSVEGGGEPVTCKRGAKIVATAGAVQRLPSSNGLANQCFSTTPPRDCP